MPYITDERRSCLFYEAPVTPGELNFLLTSLCLSYLQHRPRSYDHYNAVIGALESCKLELYRREIIPYENKKIKENGDVYD